MTRSGEGREIEAALVGAGCTVHDADDLGESKWDIAETQSSAFAHTLMDAALRETDEHDPITCKVCGGTCLWVYGDGYRCRTCDTPHNEDGTVYQA